MHHSGKNVNIIRTFQKVRFLTPLKQSHLAMQWLVRTVYVCPVRDHRRGKVVAPRFLRQQKQLCLQICTDCSILDIIRERTIVQLSSIYAQKPSCQITIHYLFMNGDTGTIPSSHLVFIYHDFSVLRSSSLFSFPLYLFLYFYSPIISALFVSILLQSHPYVYLWLIFSKNFLPLVRRVIIL